MKRTIILMTALTFTIALFAPLANATTTGPDLVAQDPAADEAAAYKAWFDENAAKNYPKAMELAKAYLDKFPSGKYADYLKTKWIPQVRGMQFKQAADAKNVGEVIRIGREVLAGDPENLDYLSAMVVQIRTHELFANPANFSHAAEAADFAERAIRLIEAGKTPTGAGKDFNPKVTLAYMHQTLAVIHDHDKKTDKALAAYEKAGELQPSNETFFFHCGRINNDKYAAAAQKYQAIPDADRDAAEPKPEVKAALDEVNKQADAVINCWAKFLGLTTEKNTWGDTRARILQAFTELYKFRHNNSTDGMDKLIEQHKPAAPSSSGSGAAAAVRQ